MTTPIRPETDNPRTKRIREVVDHYAKQGATPEEITEIIGQNHPELVATQASERAAMPTTTAENIGNAFRTTYQGATLGFGDELMGTVRGALDPSRTIAQEIADERDNIARFGREHPKIATGLEIGGGLALGAGVLGSVGRGAATAGNVMRSGAMAGGLTGFGKGEDTESRLGGAAIGAGVGGLLGLLGGSLASGRLAPVREQFAESVAGTVGGGQLPLAASGSQFGSQAVRAVGRALAPEGTAGPRGLLDVLEQQGMGDEALAMNLGDDRTVRAVRAAANQPGSRAGQIVNERLAKQGGALGEQVPRDIATATGFPADEPGALVVDRMLREAQEQARPFYDEARALGDIFPERAARTRTASMAGELEASGIPRQLAQESVGGIPAPTEADAFFDSPLVREAINRAKRLPQYADLPDTDMRVLDEVYKQIGAMQREAGSGVLGHNLGEVQRTFQDVLAERAPVYGQATSIYRDAIRPKQAFAEGLESLNAAPGEITLALRGDDPLSAQARRAGHSTAMQQAARGKASNADLGEFAQFRDVARAVVGTPAQRIAFIEMHGQDAYDAALARLMPKIRAAAQNAAARGNSTTTKQLLDALAFGDDAVMDAITAMASGNPTQGAVRGLTSMLVSPFDRAYRLGVGETATEAADLLTTKGAPKIRSLLDVLDEQSATDAARRATAGRTTGATAVGVAPTRRER